VARERLHAPLGFDADGSHYGLVWQGREELAGAALELASWLRQVCSRSFG